jgi:plasmid stabilization system protein ParE
LSEIRWLPEALNDIERLYGFLYHKNSKAAARVAQSIIEGSELLKQNPSIGRPMEDDTDRREWFIPFGAGAYVLRYRIEGKQTVIIIRVWHSRESREI